MRHGTLGAGAHAGAGAAARWVWRALAALTCLLPPLARADEAWLDALEQRLAHAGADTVNAELQREGGSAMAELNRRAAGCEFPAVSLAVRLARTRDGRAAGAHALSLRAANGSCTRFVLALVRPDEIARYCGSLPHWGPAQTARELRRRMGEIDTDAQLNTSPNGRACRAAYLHELQTTRVVVRRAS
jgi:hypothetical protein